MVSKIYYLNSDKYPVIVEDVQQVKKHVDKKNEDGFNCVFEALPQYRRTASLPDKINNGDYLTTAGILAYTAVNAREDLNDVISAGKQIYSKVNRNYHYDPLYNRKDFQHEFSATRNVIGEEALYKSASKGNLFAQKVVEIGNTTIDSTRFGKLINKIFKITEEDIKKIDAIKNYDGYCAKAYKFKSSVLGGKTIAKAMKRTTVAGVAVMGILELPKIVKETAKGDNFFEHAENFAKQTVKSAGNVALTTAGIAIGGAIGAKHLGASGSLIGMGLGAIAGNKISNQVQIAIG